MKKIIRFIVLILLVAFIVIQFFQPEKNLAEPNANHILNQEVIPDNMKVLLKGACLDCHSNQTNYLWYHKIAPVSWMVNEHIKDGKKELNFSDWGKMDIFDKIGTLEEICKETERKTMPIKSYKLMHPEAKLTDEQTAELCAWTEKLSENLLKSVEE